MPLGRKCAKVAVTAALLLVAASSRAQPNTTMPHLSAPAVNAKYVGPGGCSAVACHGGIAAATSTKVFQNEYSTWVTLDRHAHAYSALTEPLGKQIAQTLSLGPAEKAQRCLVCHALSEPESHKARSFDIAEGVSCESCHGPASEWIGPHIQAKADHTTMVSLGMVDNKNLKIRTEKCLTCHLGAPGMSVDHELIAAGHPDLTFELDSFSAVEPVHWQEKGPDGKPTTDPLFGMKAWAVGQAVELQQSMLRVSRHAKTGPWPEFSEMDCITCHHALTGPQSWRQQQGFKGHRAGDPPYNLSRYVLFRHFAEEVDPALNANLSTETHKVSMLVTSMTPDRAGVEAAANRTAELAGDMASKVREASYDLPRSERLLRAITTDADAISQAGERTAEQAAMTIDSLYIAQAKAGGPNTDTRAAIDGLFKLVNNPSAYNAPQFAAQLRKVRSTLH